MEQFGIEYYVGLLSAAQFHGVAHHRPQKLQVMTEKRRRGIACGSVRVTFVARKRLAEVPTRFFNTPRGTVRVSTVESTVVDLVGNPHRAAGLDYVAALVAELAEQIDPERLVAAARTAPIPVAQRLGHLLGVVNADDKANLLKRYVQREARDITPLMPALSRAGSVRDSDWKLDVNTDVMVES